MKNTFLAFLLFFAYTVSGQSSYWETLNPPDGGVPDQIVEHPNGWLFGKFEDNSVFRSKDGGLHWEQIFWPAEHWSNDFYDMNLGQGGALFKQRGPYYSFETFVSYDGGDTWAVLPNSFDFASVTQTKNGALFASKRVFSESQIMRSTNNGGIWQVVFEFPDPLTNTVTATENGGIYAVANNRVAVSPDDGTNWFSTQGSGFYTICCTAKKTYFFTDGHNQTRRIDSLGNITLPSYNIHGCFLTPDSLLIFTQETGWQVSYNDGLQWQASIGIPGANDFPLQVPVSTGAMICNRGNALYRSEDYGLHWDFSSYGIHWGHIRNLEIISDDTIYGNTTAGLWRTTDGGAHWDLLTENAETYADWKMGNFVVTPAGEIFACRDSDLVFSADQGQNFIELPLPEPRLEWTYLAFDPNQNVLFANTLNGLVRSADKGLTWGIPLDSFYASSIAFHPSGKIFALLQKRNVGGYELYESSDNGQTWTLTPNAPYVKYSHVTIDQNGDVLCLEPFFKSSDMGVSWQSRPIKIDDGLNTGQAFVKNALGHYYFTSYFNGDINLWASVDDGQSSFTLPTLVNPPFHNIYSIDLNNASGKLYVASAEYPKAYLSRSTHSTHSGAYLTGTVFKDADEDCSTQDPEAALQSWIVRADGDDTWYAHTDTSGRYTMFLDTGAYFLTTKPTLGILWQTCGDSLPVQVPELLNTTTQDVPILSLADCPYMTVDVAIPALERCFNSKVWLKYCNLGTQPADSVWLDVTLDPLLTMIDTLHNFEVLGNNTFRFQLGAVSLGTCGSLSFWVYTNCDSTVLGQTLCVAAHIYPDSVCIPIPGWSGAEIQVTARCEQDTVYFDATNVGEAPSQPLQYYVIEDDVVMMQNTQTLQVAESSTFAFPGNGSYLRFESEQEPGHPFSIHVAAWAEACGGLDLGSLGFVNQYFVDNGIPAQDVECTAIVGSFDPNDKQGFPIGAGESHFIEPNTDLEYLIRFQNTGTAPAHFVVVRDTISTLLDPSSLLMGPSSHPYTWSLDGQGFLKVTFADINLPDSNANEAASHGFFSFKIAQKKDLPLGSEIFNSASIYFDFNGAVRTNETQHRIGRDFLEIVATEMPRLGNAQTHVSPNPLGESAILTFSGLEEREYRFLLTDLHGRELRNTIFQRNTLRFQRETLKSGVYFYQILDAAGNVVGAGKLLLK